MGRNGSEGARAKSGEIEEQGERAWARKGQGKSGEDMKRVRRESEERRAHIYEGQGITLEAQSYKYGRKRTGQDISDRRSHLEEEKYGYIDYLD